ncbi:FIVAR domain-containing protein [Mycoplasmoides gallisepticum]|uniref:FIVAR domain-containing protein n=3 Tax=Mycoplasmoides gallisepticum TaxID=2096 RepID=UPI0007FFAE2C|nr:FIVAR domain-containing protein [Mycoplasmoides gallisepticum]OBU79180.1 hypothetical protein BAY37_01625 [Mycoplasmoides gallisepticum]QEX46669.1 hypothetical protein F6J64_02435 [Mycoplasmoides gallisepticum]
MKRKNILKFVSLLGIGSFVMLAAASCTSATTPTPNPEPKPTPKPDPMPNPPSGGMNGGDTNPGNGGGMDSSAQQLAAAKTALTTLLNGQTEKVGLYNDYAKIKDDLVKAYTAAKEISDKSDATSQELNNAKTTLETAITNAANSKTSFDEKNPELIKAYNALKETITSEEMSLNQLMDANFETIKNHISNLYKEGKDIITATLDPATGNVPQVMVVNQTNEAIVNATSKLDDWKNNAITLNTSFLKEILKSASLSAATGDNATTVQQQPGDYSFVAYASDIASPNWNFAQRTVWTADNKLVTSPLPNNSQNSAPLTDVSWIYTLSGTGAKYTLTFDYYGPQTGYLYFPYKLVKDTDKNNIGLQYKLNDGNFEQINFAPAQPVEAGPAEPARSTMPQSTPANQTSGENMTAASQLNPTPTVSDINVAKVTLSNLKFGSNTIEFSVPMNKVAPMIGNMYITSDVANKKQIYDSIFGNTSSQTASQTSVSVDLLKGYSLATSWRTYIRQFTGLTDNGRQTSDPVYLIGLIGGSQNRAVARAQMNIKNIPHVNNDGRTFTIYVNAPTQGEYHISGAYLQGSDPARSLKFSTGDMAQNVVTVTNLKQDNWTTLGHFDTNKMDSTNVSGAGNQMKRTLTLNKGLNKIILSGVSNRDTPFIGNLTFTLSDMTQSAASTGTSETTSATKAK